MTLKYFVRISGWSRKSAEEIAKYLTAPVQINLRDSAQLFGRVRAAAQQAAAQQAAENNEDAEQAVQEAQVALIAALRQLWALPGAWMGKLDGAIAAGDQEGATVLLLACPVDFGGQAITLAIQILNQAIVTRAESMPAQIGPDPNDPSHWAQAPQVITAEGVTAALDELGWKPNADGSGWERK